MTVGQAVSGALQEAAIRPPLKLRAVRIPSRLFSRLGIAGSTKRRGTRRAFPVDTLGFLLSPTDADLIQVAVEGEDLLGSLIHPQPQLLEHLEESHGLGSKPLLQRHPPEVVGGMKLPRGVVASLADGAGVDKGSPGFPEALRSIEENTTEEKTL